MTGLWIFSYDEECFAVVSNRDARTSSFSLTDDMQLIVDSKDVR